MPAIPSPGVRVDAGPEGKAPRWRPGFRTQGTGLSAGCGSCPLPSVPARRIVGKMAQRKRPVKTEPTPPSEDVRRMQERTGSTEADFLHDLNRASTNRADERLA